MSNSAKQIADGQQAAIERGQIKEAVDWLKSDLLEKIANSAHSETDVREQLYYQYRVIDMVMARLQVVIDKGKVAATFEQ